MAEAVMGRTMVPGAPPIVVHEETKPFEVVPPQREVRAEASSSEMQATNVTQSHPTVDPGLALILRGVDSLHAVADRVSTIVEKNPKNRGPVVAGILAGLIAGVFGAIGAVWVHDSETRGRLGARMDAQDKAQNEMAQVIGGLLDEYEEFQAYLPEALEAGFSGQPIPRPHSGGVRRLRRMLPP